MRAPAPHTAASVGSATTFAAVGQASHQTLRALILHVWHMNPLRCPVCQNPMRVIAVIDDRRVAEKILRHLGAWHDPPPRPPPQRVPGPYTYEPCDDVDPMPDYENVLTD